MEVYEEFSDFVECLSEEHALLLIDYLKGINEEDELADFIECELETIRRRAQMKRDVESGLLEEHTLFFEDGSFMTGYRKVAGK